jgi:hypothetical protein
MSSQSDDLEVVSDEMDTKIWLSEELGTTFMHIQDEECRVGYLLTPYTARELVSLLERWLDSAPDPKERASAD